MKPKSDSRSSLVDQFSKAGLVLKIREEPFVNRDFNKDADLIFGLDIKRSLRGHSRTEWFEVFPGSPDNVIQVRNVDKEIQQLVLLVNEPERKFTEYVAKTDWRMKPSMRPPGKIISENEQGWWIERKTPSTNRYYLLGVDERQLFIAQVRGNPTTVRQAHDLLRNTQLTLAEGRAPGKTVRQGEWFFVWPTQEETLAIQNAIKTNKVAVLKKWPIGADTAGFSGRPRVSGNPHTADELVRIPGTVLAHGHGVRSVEQYVRGSVRHKDHATVKFGGWRRVMRNNEANTSDSMGGGTWID